MQRDEFLTSILSAPGVRMQHEAVRQSLRQTFDEAGSAVAHGDGERRRAQMMRLLSVRDDILALMTCDAPSSAGGEEAGDRSVNTLDPLELAHHRVSLVTLATNVWMSLLKEFRYRERVPLKRRDFKTELCGAPAYRCRDREELRVIDADPWSLPDAQGRQHPWSIVEPFVSHRVSQRARAALYTRWMEPKLMTKDNIKSNAEASLIGQRGVFAHTAIPAGTCVGVYGGQLVDDVDTFLIQCDRYLIAVSRPIGSIAVNGENLMSLTNTLFTYDEEGRPTGHPQKGFNLHRVVFPVQMTGGWKFNLPAFFTSVDIQPGDELRWNYELGVS